MERIWLKSYEPGIPAEIPLIPYTSLADFCDQICKQYADKSAFSNFGVTITYKKFDEYTRAIAAFLRVDLKLKQGDAVAIMLPNSLQYPISLFGILRAGLVAVNVNPQYTKSELEFELKDSGAKAIIAWDGCAQVVEKALSGLSNPPQVIITHLGDLMSSWKNFALQFALKFIKKKIPVWKIKNAWYFNETIAYGKKQSIPPLTIRLDDVAFLQYTGGTTGRPKGAMLSHHNMLANIMQAVTWVKNVFKAGGGDVAVSPLPFYHIFSLTANCMLWMAIGGHNILITDPRNIPAFIKELKKYPFQFITGVNTLFNALLNHPEFKNIDFSKMKLTLGGGMAIQQIVADKWQKITGKSMLEGYGLTECSPAVTISPANSKKFNGSAGIPIPSTDIDIRDENGKALGINESGELWVKGPQVMLGYWKQSEETALAIDKNGWVRTGDIVKIDENGYVYLLDRIKDMIKVSGFNVYPNEIEDIVAKMPGVLEVAAIGVPDEHSGEVPKLFVVKKDPNLSVEDVMKYCHENMTGYKRPKYVEFREELPKSNVGKVLRRALRS